VVAMMVVWWLKVTVIVGGRGYTNGKWCGVLIIWFVAVAAHHKQNKTTMI
jgi:hypothetical protein